MKRIRLLSQLLLLSALLFGNVIAQNNCFREWRYVQGITIQNVLFGTLNDWQVKVNLNTQAMISAGKLNADASDLRFVSADCCTELPYWIQSGLNTSSTEIWVRVPQVAPNGTTQIRAYYGNPAANVPVSNIDLVHFSIGNDSMGTDTAIPGITAATQLYTFPINSTTVRWKIYSGDTMSFKLKVSNDTNMVTGTSPVFSVPSQPGFYLFDWAGGVTAGGHPGWFTNTGGNFLNNCATTLPCPGSCGDIVYQPGDLGVFGALDSLTCGAYPSMRVWYRRRAFVDPSSTIGAEFDRQQAFASFAPSGTIMCFSDTLPVFVNSNGAASYQWFFNNQTIVGAVDTSYNAMLAGNYYCVATFANACQTLTSDTITMQYLAPSADLGPDTLVCTDTGYTLDAGAGYASYLWDDASTSQTRFVTISGTYSVTVWDTGGCSISDTINIILRANPNPVITPAGPLTICPGESVNLNTQNNNWYAYQWLPNGETSGNISVSSPGDYSVIVWDSAYCFDTSAVVTISNFAQPILDLGPDQEICQGDSVVLDAGAGWDTYSWPDGSSQQSLTVYTTGSFIAVVTDLNNCTDRDTATITVHQNPIVDLGPSDSICPGTTVTLDAGSGWANVAWMNGATSQTISGTAPGAFFVTVTDSNGCTDSSPILYLMAIPLDVAPIIVRNGGVLESTPAAGYQWYLNGNMISGATSQTHAFQEPGFYTVGVPAQSVCSSNPTLFSNQIEILLGITADQIPEGFSPNGDNLNDVFEIQNLGQYTNSSLVVINRWGNEVFRKAPYDNSFKGISDDGKTLPDGTYFYILDLGNDQDIFKGYLIINR